MRQALPVVTLLALALAGCPAPAGGPTGGASASPSAKPAGSPTPGAAATPGATATATPAAGGGIKEGEVVPGTSTARAITYTLTVDGKPAEMEPLASYHNAPGSNGSIFWDMGVYAKTPGQQPTGALAAGKFVCTVHMAAASVDKDFFLKVRTLTEAEFLGAVKFTLREGVTVPEVKVPITREWYVDNKTAKSNLKGSLTRTGDTAEFKLSATMPEDKYNGKPHTVDVTVSGLPLPKP